MFMGPLEDAKPWNTKGIIGVYRFLERVYKLNSKLQDSNPKQITNDRIQNLIHKTIRKVSGDSPVGLKSTSSGSSTGRSFSGTGIIPSCAEPVEAHLSQ